MLIATSVTGHPVVVLLLAHYIWARAHVFVGATSTSLPQLVGGLLEVYLWLVGLWWLAIAVHAGNNLFAILSRVAVREWPRLWPGALTPGQVHHALVGREVHSGLHEARTLDGKRLLVPDVEEDAVCRVRIAYRNEGEVYGYPAFVPSAAM